MNQIKKISLILNDLEPRGVQRVTLSLAVGLCELDQKVDIVVLDTSGPLRNKIPLRARLHDIKSQRAIYSLSNLIKHIRQNKPDICIVAEDHLGLIVTAACVISGSSAKVLITSHVRYSQTNLLNGFKGRLFKILFYALWRRIDKFCPVSNGLAGEISRIMKIDRRDLCVLPNAVITEGDINRSPDRNLHPFFLQPNQKVLLAVGSLNKGKGFSDLISAFAIVKKKINCSLIIIGDGPERVNLLQQIVKQDLERAVDLVGYKSEPRLYMQTADVFVLTSYFEGLPTVLIEALASGCPCVSTDCEFGPREILCDGRYGRLAPVGDVVAIANAIIKTLEEPINPASLFSAARKYTSRQVAVEALRLLEV